MRNIIWVLALFLLLLVQGGILFPLHIAPVSLILLVVIVATILSSFSQGLIVTLIGGLLVDFISGSPDGLVSMSFVIVFLIIHLLLHEFLSREVNRFILFTIVVGGTALYFLIFLSVEQVFGIFDLTQKVDINYLLSVQLPLMLMWNLFFTYPIFKYYEFVQNLVARVPHHESRIEI